MKKRVFSMLLVVCLLINMFSACVYAEDNMDMNNDEKIMDEGAFNDDLDDVVEEVEESDQLNEDIDEELIVAEGSELDGSGDTIYHLAYSGHVQNIGWQDPCHEGEIAGTSGRSLRVEALKLELNKEVEVDGETELQKVTGEEGGITYRGHVQNIGWQDWVSDGEIAGTSGRSLRVEAFQIKLTGQIADSYDIYYRVHSQNVGWMGWAKNGALAGTSGYSYRMEALQIYLVKKGEPAPEAVNDTNVPYLSATNKGVITYQVHAENYGWMSTVADGQLAGTTGKGYRLEALKMWLNNPIDEATGEEIEGSVRYSAHVQNVGWQDWTSEGNAAGTSGRSLRVEALKVELTGAIADSYSVSYRVHVQDLGTLGWVSDGAMAGTAGMSKRVESIEVVVTKKDEVPTSGGRGFIGSEDIGELTGSYNADSTWSSDIVGKKIVVGRVGESLKLKNLKLDIDNTGSLFDGSIKYKAMTENGWTEYAADSTPLVNADEKDIQAVQMVLEGELASYCDVYYRSHVQNRGWMGWTKNGSASGTEGYGLGVEAVEVTVVLKGGQAPGSTSNAFDKYNSAYQQMTNRVQGMTSGTGYLIAVDCKANIVGVYTGSKGNWRLLHTWICTSGAPATPTCKGQYSIIYKKPAFGDTYTAWYASFFQSNGYAFHSVLYLPGSKTQFRDPRLGMDLSHGCVRLAIENAQWIYNNCGNGTRVYTY